MNFTQEERARYIGGSDAGAVLGVNPYKTPLDLWLEKTCKAPMEDISHKNAVRWGTKLEQFVAEEYEYRTGEKLRRDNLLHIHPKHEFIAANLDRRVVGKKKLVEIKTSTSYTGKDFGKEGTAEVPMHYLAQCAHYMAVCDIDETDLVVAMLDKRDIAIYTIERDLALEEVIIQKECEFWELVQSGTPPPAQTPEDVSKLYPQANGLAVSANDGVEAQLSELTHIKEEIKKLQEEQKQKEANIKAFLSENEVLLSTAGQQLATWKNQVANRFDSKAFKEAHPDLHEQFIKPSVSRVFRIH